MIRGEGEQTFLELVRYFLFEEKDLSEIPGIAFREGTQILETKKRSLIQDLDRIPSPYLCGVDDLNETGPQV